MKYLLGRDGVFYFRRAVPRDLRSVLARSELVRSLSTRDRREARGRAFQLYVGSQRLFAKVRMYPEFTKTMLVQLVQDFYNTALHEENHSRLLRPRIAESDGYERILHYAELAAGAKHSLATNNLADADLASELILRKHGIFLDTLSDQQRAEFNQAVLRVSVEIANTLKERYQGNFNYEPGDQLLKIKLENAATIAGPTVQVVPAPGKLPSSPHIPALAEVFSIRAEAFRQSQILRKVWSQQTAMQASATYRMFIEVCGDRPLASYVRADAKLMRTQLERLPYDYSKHPRYRGRSVDEVLALFAALPTKAKVPLLTSRTVQRHFSVLSALWIDALEADEVSANIFEGFKFVAGARAVDQRDRWELDALKQLFASPVWTGCASSLRRSQPGPLILKDEKYWIPLIAVLSGMRQEEICQLHASDVREEEGVWFFDVNTQSGGKLKNRSAARMVPIHDAILRLGFLSYVAKTGNGDRAIFPNLKPGGADMRLGHAFAKWFTRYRRDVGVYRKMLDFHSFRHTATTLMHQAGADRFVIDHLTGHTSPGETSRYTKGSSLQQLKAAIDSINADAFLDIEDMKLG